MIALLPQVIVDVLLTGSIYAILAIGLTMVFGVMRIVNFAHGDFLMIVLYVPYILSAWLGIELFLPVIAILPLVTLLASLSFRFLISMAYRRGRTTFRCRSITRMTPSN